MQINVLPRKIISVINRSLKGGYSFNYYFTPEFNRYFEKTPLNFSRGLVVVGKTTDKVRAVFILHLWSCDTVSESCQSTVDSSIS